MAEAQRVGLAMQDNELRGLHVMVYRPVRWMREGVDNTLGGASSTAEGFCVIGLARRRRDTFEPLPRDCQVFAPDAEHPAAVLVRALLRGEPPHLVPLDIFDSGRWRMPGGNLADSLESRWRDLVSSFLPTEGGPLYVSAVDIHDRVDGQPEAPREAPPPTCEGCGPTPLHIVKSTESESDNKPVL
jgi:hypothetical protein